MGNETPAEQRLLETVPILDFLYIDNERIDSFLSQINQGTLRSVTRSQGVSENSSRDAGVSVKLLRGEAATKTDGVQSNQSPNKSIPITAKS